MIYLESLQEAPPEIPTAVANTPDEVAVASLRDNKTEMHHDEMIAEALRDAPWRHTEPTSTRAARPFDREAFREALGEAHFLWNLLMSYRRGVHHPTCPTDAMAHLVSWIWSGSNSVPAEVGFPPDNCVRLTAVPEARAKTSCQCSTKRCNFVVTTYRVGRSCAKR
jgi:hypothetical protein